MLEERHYSLLCLRAAGGSARSGRGLSAGPGPPLVSLKSLGRTPAVQGTIGRALAGYLRLVRRTNRFVLEPADLYARLTPIQPFIGAMWPQSERITRHSAPGITRASFFASTGGK